MSDSHFNDPGSPISGYRKEAVSAYSYLSRSTRVECENVRQFFNGVLNSYNLSDKDDVLGKLQSHDDVAFQSAILELFVYAALRAGGIEVMEAEPDRFSTKGKPDYLCRSGNGYEFLVEVKNLSEHSAEERAAHKRFSVLRQRLNDLGTEEFFLDLAIRELPTENLPIRKIETDVKRWLASLDYNEVSNSMKEGDGLPSNEYEFVWPIGKPIFILKPIPRSIAALQIKPERSVGMETLAKWSDARIRICEALKEKARKYGNITVPYFIILNAEDFFADFDDFFDALFGSLAVQVTRRGSELAAQTIRQADGLLGTADNWKFTRVTGVAFVRGLNAFSLNEGY